jgi:hypothetical protein
LPKFKRQANHEHRQGHRDIQEPFAWWDASHQLALVTVIALWIPRHVLPDEQPGQKSDKYKPCAFPVKTTEQGVLFRFSGVPDGVDGVLRSETSLSRGGPDGLWQHTVLNTEHHQ